MGIRPSQAANGASPRGGDPKQKRVESSFGLVCVTAGPEVRYRTITRTRFLELTPIHADAALEAIYLDNIRMLFTAIDFCHARGIRMYRATSATFPQIDHPIGRRVLARVRPMMAPFGAYARRHGVRVLLHPDQYVVLNSESEPVCRNSLEIMQDHALTMDWLNLPCDPWACMILHGGKGGRADELVAAIDSLPPNIRRRLVLENDEHIYNAAAILDICRRTGAPFVFDAHHHVVAEKLNSYEDPSVAFYTRAARGTWPNPMWQLVHLSNGAAEFADSKHSELVTVSPSAYRGAPWVEVEAKGKELAIEQLSRALRPDADPGPDRTEPSGCAAGCAAE